MVLVVSRLFERSLLIAMPKVLHLSEIVSHVGKCRPRVGGVTRPIGSLQIRARHFVEKLSEGLVTQYTTGFRYEYMLFSFMTLYSSIHLSAMH